MKIPALKSFHASLAWDTSVTLSLVLTLLYVILGEEARSQYRWQPPGKVWYAHTPFSGGHFSQSFHQFVWPHGSCNDRIFKQRGYVGGRRWGQARKRRKTGGLRTTCTAKRSSLGVSRWRHRIGRIRVKRSATMLEAKTSITPCRSTLSI